MKKTLFYLFFIFSCVPYALGQNAPTAPYLPAEKSIDGKTALITVQYPYEKMKVPRGATHIFLLGQVKLRNAQKLTINGKDVPLAKNGAFVAFLPVQNGEFPFLLTASNKKKVVQAVRRVIVPGMNLADLSAKASFDPEEIFPQTPTELRTGDKIELSARATPGAVVTAALPGLKNTPTIKLKEDTFSPGIYRASYPLKWYQKPAITPVVYSLKNGPDNSTAQITAPGKIKVSKAKAPFQYARVKLPGVKMRNIPTTQGNLHPYYRAYGQVRLSGRLNNQYRVVLNDKESAWLEEKHLALLPQGENLPNLLNSIEEQTSEEKTRFVFSGQRAVPISVHEYFDRLEIILYDTNGLNFSLNKNFKSPLVEKIVRSQPAKNTLMFTLYYRQYTIPWGHAYDFEGNKLLLDLMHTPQLPPNKKYPLKGARIVIDAGHSPHDSLPYDGAVGPTGYLEYQATMALAKDVKELLEKEGATVLTPRWGNNHMSLQDRYEFAMKEKAHLFISLHYNALEATKDPLIRDLGYSIYYTYPHSLSLAKSVYDSFRKHVPLPDNGLRANDVLFIPRIPQIPSILIENAYLLDPEQEKMARSKKGRAFFAEAIVEGILTFYEQVAARRGGYIVSE